MPAQTLRPYQESGIARTVEAWKQGARSVLMISPTGSGKTSIFTYLTAQVSGAGRRALILVHRRELATQACNRLREFGVDYGLIMAGELPRRGARVQVASVQTLIRRDSPPADLVICDEAHLSTAETWRKILDEYPRARILGVTATPWRLGGKPLAGSYDASVVVTTPRELREQGHLCDFVGFSFQTPDLSGVKSTGGDYNEQQTAALMSQSAIVDNVVEMWLRHASHLSTVVFAVTVEHSQKLMSQFRAAGVRAEHLDGMTPLEQRRSILKRVDSGQTQVLCNVGVAVEGLDIPRLKCCILARPTKSLARYIQMVGRVRRPWKNEIARVHDHSFNVKLHGLPDADRDYSLSAKPEKPPSLTQCSDCFALYSGDSCPSCGKAEELEPRGEREIATVSEAEQFEFTSTSEIKPDDLPPVDVKWDKPGRVIEGQFLRFQDEPSSFGAIRWYLVRGKKRVYRLPGTAHLRALMRGQIPDSQMRITYEGDLALTGGKVKKMFKLEIDDGT